MPHYLSSVNCCGASFALIGVKVLNELLDLFALSMTVNDQHQLVFERNWRTDFFNDPDLKARLLRGPFDLQGAARMDAIQYWAVRAQAALCDARDFRPPKSAVSRESEFCELCAASRSVSTAPATTTKRPYCSGECIDE